MTDTVVEPWRSCFIAGFPTMRAACDAIAALHENTEVVRHRVQGIFPPSPDDPDYGYEVFFALAAGDSILPDGYEGEGAFIRAAAALGGRHTGS